MFSVELSKHYINYLIIFIFTDSVPDASFQFSNESKEIKKPGGVLPHIRYIGMCRPKGYGF